MLYKCLDVYVPLGYLSKAEQLGQANEMGSGEVTHQSRGCGIKSLRFPSISRRPWMLKNLNLKLVY